MLEALATWLATYALHSTLLLGSAWLLARVFPAAGERLWRTALFGGLLTATLQAGEQLPRLAYLDLPGWPAVDDGQLSGATVDQRHVHAASRPAAAGTLAKRPRNVAALSAAASKPAGTDRGSAGVDATLEAPKSSTQRSNAVLWRTLAIGWMVAASASLAMLAYRAARFRWRFLAHRVTANGATRGLLENLARRAAFRRDLRVTLAAAARVPMARGCLRPEICLPPGLESELAPAELEAALAHELAHLERQDPLWRAITRVLTCALPFQPLNRIACRALEDEAELRCDDRAATLTGRPVVLARCLTRVAGWTVGVRPTELPALAASGTTLRRRVTRLLEGAPRRSTPRWTHALSALPLAAVVAFAPGLGAAPPLDGSSSAASAAEEAPAPAVTSPLPVAQARAASNAPIVHRLIVPVFATTRVEPPVPPAVPAAPDGAPIAPVPPEPPAAPTVPEAPNLPTAPVPPGAPAASAAAPVAPAAPAAPARPSAPAAPSAGEEDEGSADHESAEGDDDTEESNESESEESESDESDEDDDSDQDDESLDALSEEIDEIMELVEAEIEAAMEAVESALDQEIGRLEETIEATVESFEIEIERSLEPLEEALDTLDEAREEAAASGDAARADAIARQIGELGSAMGDLGGRLGALVSESALHGIDRHAQELIGAHSRAIGDIARAQAEVAERLAAELEERHRDGRPLGDEEIESLREEVRRIGREAAPHQQELERTIQRITIELAPTLDRTRELEVEIRREVDAWRLRHAALLRRLEQDRLTGPTGDAGAEPDRDPDPETEPGADPNPAPAPDPSAYGDFAWNALYPLSVDSTPSSPPRRSR